MCFAETHLIHVQSVWLSPRVYCHSCALVVCSGDVCLIGLCITKAAAPAFPSEAQGAVVLLDLAPDVLPTPTSMQTGSTCTSHRRGSQPG